MTLFYYICHCSSIYSLLLYYWRSSRHKEPAFNVRELLFSFLALLLIYHIRGFIISRLVIRAFYLYLHHMLNWYLILLGLKFLKLLSRIELVSKLFQVLIEFVRVEIWTKLKSPYLFSFQRSTNRSCLWLMYKHTCSWLSRLAIIGDRRWFILWFVLFGCP